MDCRRAREGLWPPELPRLCADDVLAAQVHIEGCKECAAYFQQDRALLDAYARLRDERAPRDVREKVFDELARVRWDLGGTSGAEAVVAPVTVRWMRWPVAAVASLVIFLGWQAYATGGGAVTNDADLFVEDYLRRVVGEDHIETSNPEEVVRFLRRELGMSIRPLSVAGLELERAEICLFEGQRGALIVYKQNGRAISHYLVPREGTEPRAPSVQNRGGGIVDTEMPVVTWSTGDVEQALVGEVAAPRLLALVGLGTTF